MRFPRIPPAIHIRSGLHARAGKRKRAGKVKTLRDSVSSDGDPMSQTRRPNELTFEYLYARHPLARILIERRAKRARECLSLRANDAHTRAAKTNNRHCLHN